MNKDMKGEIKTEVHLKEIEFDEKDILIEIVEELYSKLK